MSENYQTLQFPFKAVKIIEDKQTFEDFTRNLTAVEGGLTWESNYGVFLEGNMKEQGATRVL